MIEFKVGIAGHIVGIETIHARAMAMCHNFITDQKPEFNIKIDLQDIEKEREKYIAEHGECKIKDSSLEIMALQRKLSDGLNNFGVIMLHGAAVVYDNKTYIFSAKSGTGKSTHIFKWISNLSEAYVINGDKPFISTDPIPMVYGSPWAGKEDLYRNSSAPLKAIVFLERDEDNSILRIAFPEAFPLLYEQIYRTNDNIQMRKTLASLQKLGEKVEFYKFKINNFKDDCFRVAYDTLVRGL